MDAEWPFDDLPDLGVVTLTRITDGSNPILYVARDEDGEWQFLDNGEITEDDIEIVSLQSVVELDSTIKELADLPLGCVSEREAVGKPWKNA